MKIKKEIVFIIFGINLICQASNISGYHIFNPFPEINTDKEEYFPNEIIKINASWNILKEIDENLEIKIIFLEENPDNLTINDALSHSIFNIQCPIQNGITNFQPSINSTQIMGNLSQIPSYLWINLVFIKRIDKEIINYDIFSKILTFKKYDPIFLNNFSIQSSYEFQEKFNLNNTIIANENSSIFYKESSTKVNIYDDIYLIDTNIINTSDTGLFLFNSSIFIFNKTGTFDISIIILGNKIFNNAIYNFSLNISEKELYIQFRNQTRFPINNINKTFNLEIFLTDNINTAYEFDDLNISIESELNYLGFSKENTIYKLKFNYPEQIGNYSLNLSINKNNYFFFPLLKDLNFYKSKLSIQLTLREKQNINNISFNIEINSSVKFEDLNIDTFNLNFFNINKWINITYFIINCSNAITSIYIKWIDLKNLNNVLNNSQLQFKVIFIEDNLYRNATSNILSINFPLQSNFIANSTSIIQGQSIQFNFTGLEGNVPVSFLWNFGDGNGTSNEKNPTYLYNSIGNFDVSLIIEDSDGDQDIMSLYSYIHVIGDIKPMAKFLTNSTSIIQGQIIQFYFTGGEGNGLVSFLWNFGDDMGTSNEKNPTYFYNSIGNFDVSLIIEDLDGDQDFFVVNNCISVVQDLEPIVNFSTNSTTVIQGQNIQFNFTGFEGNGLVSFLWDFGDEMGTSNERNPTYVYNSDGNFNVSLTIEDRNGDQDFFVENNCISVVQDLEPIVNFSTNSTTVIQGQNIQFNFTGFEGNGLVSFLWDFGDEMGTSNERNPTYIYNSDGNFNVSLIIEDLDGDQDFFVENNCISVIQDLEPIVNFSTNSTNIIQGQIIQFNFTGVEGNGPVSFLWDFGDGTGTSNEENTTYIYKSNGIFNVSLTIEDLNGDQDILKKINFIIVIKDLKPIADFSTNSTNIIQGQIIQFNFTGVEGNGLVSFLWDFGDGTGTSNEKNTTYIYNSYGNFNVSLTIEDLDGDQDILSLYNYIHVIEDVEPIVDFSINSSKIIQGQNIQFYFTGIEGNGPVSFLWDFGDELGTSEEKNPIYIYKIIGNYTINLKITDYDNDSTSFSRVDYIIVTKNLFPNASFIILQDSHKTNQKLYVNFTGFEGNGPASFLWDFGDGIGTSEKKNPSYIYNKEGNYIITLKIVDYNGDISIQTIKLVIKKNFSYLKLPITFGFIAIAGLPICYKFLSKKIKKNGKLLHKLKI